MNDLSVVNIVLWVAQVILGLFFFGGGVPKILGRGLEIWTGEHLPRQLVVFIGTAEILGGLGLVLPMAVGVCPG